MDVLLKILAVTGVAVVVATALAFVALMAGLVIDALLYARKEMREGSDGRL